MTKSTMLERATRDGAERINCVHMADRCVVGNGCTCRHLARAVIEALREPDEAMIAAALKACDENGYQVTRGYIIDDDVKTAFTAMIDAILAKQGRA